MPRLVVTALVLLAACSPQQQVRNALVAEVNARPVPGAVVAVSIPGQPVFVEAAGQRGPVDPTPLVANDRFVIGSATKMFTAQLILQLAGEGRLSLDTPISRWFPELPRANTTTVRHLLRHQSGLPEYFTHPDIEQHLLTPRTPRALLSMAAALPYTNEAPSDVAQYSNTNYVALALIVEHERGMSWSKAVKQFISTPLGLESVGFVGDDGVTDGLALGLLSDPKFAAWPSPFAVDASLGYGAGGLVSSAADLLTFLQAVKAGTLITDEMRTAQWDTVGFDVDGIPGRYGAGLMELSLPAQMGGFTVRGHQGGIPGYCSMPFYDVKTGAMVVVLANGTIGADIDEAQLALNVLSVAVANAK